MIEITPCIGERYRDTARDIAHITHLARFRDARQQTADAREDRLMRTLLPLAQLRNATVEQLDRAKAAGLDQLNQGRSMARALQYAQKHLPRKPTPPLAG